MMTFPRRTLSRMSAMVALGLLAGCAPVNTQIGYRDLSPSYNIQNFDTYLQGRDTRVVVEGDTFSLIPQAFGDLVTAAMEGHVAGGDTHFTIRPTNADPDFRVVMAFNVASMGSDALCRTKNPKPEKTSGVTTLQAAWCWDHGAQSYVSARTPATDPNDPRFRKLIGAVTRELFPRYYTCIPEYGCDDGGDDNNTIP